MYIYVYIYIYNIVYIYIYNKTNIYRNTRKMHITTKQSSAFKRLLETLLHAIKMCTGFTTDVI